MQRSLIFVGLDGNCMSEGQSTKAFLADDMLKSFGKQVYSAIHIDLDNNFTTLKLNTYGFNGRKSNEDLACTAINSFNLSDLYSLQGEHCPFIEQVQTFIDIVAQDTYDYSFQLLDFRYKLVIKSFFKNLLSNVYGYPDEPHSHFLAAGIQSLSIFGVNSKYFSKRKRQLDLLAVSFHHLIQSLQQNDALDQEGHQSYIALGIIYQIQFKEYSKTLS